MVAVAAFFAFNRLSFSSQAREGSIYFEAWKGATAVEYGWLSLMG
jgi:hypothetical protein